MYKCACCGCYTLPLPSDRAVAYICPVCFWENDVFIQKEDEPSDENGGMTLAEARQNFHKYGAAEERFIKDARPPTMKEQQDV